MEHPGARHHTSVFYGEGLDVANQTRASGGGEKMFLTSPYIDQAFSQACAVSSPFQGILSVMAMLRQLPFLRELRMVGCVLRCGVLPTNKPLAHNPVQD